MLRFNPIGAPCAWVLRAAVLGTLLLSAPQAAQAQDPLQDGSFELQAAGEGPHFPWGLVTDIPNAEAVHTVRPNGDFLVTDLGFPTDGEQWLDMWSGGDHSVPPSHPGGVTEPAEGGYGIQQDFQYEAGKTQLSFSARFLIGEDLQSEYNDWMGVEVTDGTTTVSIYYADTFSPIDASAQSLNVFCFGCPATHLEEVSVDLATLFPESTPETVFTFLARVGNGMDNGVDSQGYLDGIQLGPVPSDWEDLGNGLPTVNGEALLEGLGTLTPGASARLSQTGGFPGALAWVVLGQGEALASFKGGILVPNADAILGPVPLDASGSLLLGANWPSEFVSGQSLSFQVWYADPAGPSGFAATNGVRGTTP